MTKHCCSAASNRVRNGQFTTNMTDNAIEFGLEGYLAIQKFTDNNIIGEFYILLLELCNTALYCVSYVVFILVKRSPISILLFFL